MTEPILPADAGTIMIFARSLGDENPMYRDAEYAATTEVGTIVAPPTFVESMKHFDPESKLRPRPGEPWKGSAAEPTGTPGTTVDGPLQVHAEQHFEYHQPLRAGTLLTFRRIDGRTWEKTNRAQQVLRFSERITEFRDQEGELVVTSRSVVVEIPRKETGH